MFRFQLSSDSFYLQTLELEVEYNRGTVTYKDMSTWPDYALRETLEKFPFLNAVLTPSFETEIVHSEYVEIRFAAYVKCIAAFGAACLTKLADPALSLSTVFSMISVISS